jgi:hypothetical protein
LLKRRKIYVSKLLRINKLIQSTVCCEKNISKNIGTAHGVNNEKQKHKKVYSDGAVYDSALLCKRIFMPSFCFTGRCNGLKQRFCR